MPHIISNQADWQKICQEFQNSSQYREFGKKYQFNPMSKIFRTGLSVDEVLLKSKKGPGHRRKIFEEYLRNGRTVAEVNDDTRAMKAGKDYDIFIGLYRKFIRISD